MTNSLRLIFACCIAFAFFSHDTFAQESAEEKAKRIATGFANVKNAALAIKDGTVQDIQGHYGWAINQDFFAIRKESLKFLKEIKARREEEVKAKDLCLSFGYLKEAKLLLVNSKSEGIQGHTAWCTEATPEERAKEYDKFLRQLFEYFE